MAEYYKNYKIRIYPTSEQKEVINDFINKYRFVYNWTLSQAEEQEFLYNIGEVLSPSLSFYTMCQKYKDMLSEPDNIWLAGFPNTTARNAIKDAIYALNMHKKCNFGKPKFKSKKHSPRIFKTRSDRFLIRNGHIRFEGLPKANYHSNDNENINIGYNLTIESKIHSPQIFIDKSGKYFATFSIVQESKPLETAKTEAIGIDLGVRRTMVLSNGNIYTRPKDKIQALNKRISRIQHHITRDIQRRIIESQCTKTKYDDIPKSHRALKREQQLYRLLDKRHNIKSNWYHTTVKNICLTNPEAIVMEDIQVRRQQRNTSRPVRRNIDKSDFRWIRNLFEYNCCKYDIPFILADPNFPSSQICSCCGNIQKIKFGVRRYRCNACGANLDRDINAAINLRNLYTGC